MKLLKQLTILLLCFFSISPALKAQITNPDGIQYHWRTDTTKKIVALHEFHAVAPRKTFPIIDFPEFMLKEEGEQHFYRHEPVICVEINGQAKAYPLSILTMHEISNDTLNNVPILPTYCPLCNSSMVFDRSVKKNGIERTLEFEVSGMLRESDMVMFDRQTESWWQQLIGEAEVGYYTGSMLDIIPSQIISVEDFFDNYPEGRIMSIHTHTEAEQRYGSNPYFHYDSIGSGPYVKYFDSSHLDPRLPAMERVLDVHGDGHDKIYPFSEIAKAEVVNDSLDGDHIVIFFHAETVSALDAKIIAHSKQVGSAAVFNATVEGKTLFFSKEGKFFKDSETGSLWDITGHCREGAYKGKRLWLKAHSNDFAFAYLTFHPEAIIYRSP